VASALLACAACRSPAAGNIPRRLIEPRAPVVLTGAPLQLRGRGLWDPAEQHWGEPEDTIAAPLGRVIAAGPRPQFEFEQLLPGGENPDAEDPILRALALRDRGERARATRLPEGLVEWDARCLDAHAHLGALVSETTIARRRSRITRPGCASASAR
jgi:hypothetical protein